MQQRLSCQALCTVTSQNGTSHTCELAAGQSSETQQTLGWHEELLTRDMVLLPKDKSLRYLTGHSAHHCWSVDHESCTTLTIAVMQGGDPDA